jgi:hypothetical protein
MTISTPALPLSLPNVYDCVVGDYITYSIQGENPTTLGWGRLQENTSRKTNRLFVRNELDDSMPYHFFSDNFDNDSKLAYRFPDKETNALLRELPSKSVREMLGSRGDYSKEEAKTRDIFGTPIQKGDLVTFAYAWRGVKLGQVIWEVSPRSTIIHVRSIEENSERLALTSDVIAVVPASEEVRASIHAMTPREIYRGYLEEKSKSSSSTMPLKSAIQATG